MDGAAMILQPELFGQNKGLYICWAYFYHHKATVNIQVEVMSEDEQFSKYLWHVYLKPSDSISILRWFNSSVLAFLRCMTYLWCICGFILCVAVLVTMICTSSAAAILLIFVVVLYICWWVPTVSTRQVMCWWVNEASAASAIQDRVKTGCIPC